jgi:GDP-mannose 6-dehydrogenase
VKISVFGLGYVGTVSAACLARDGHDVIGVDPNETKVDLVRRGVSPVIETGLKELVEAAITRGLLDATPDAARAVAETDLSIVCVGTPSQSNGGLDVQFLQRVCEEIGAALAIKDGDHTVVIRSTVLPGTTEGTVIPTLEASSGKREGNGFGVCFNPEFLREGSAVFDFDHPPKTVIGETDARSGERVAALYEGLDAPLIRTEIPVAEMVKYADNAWHGLKIGFANEVGNVAKAVGIDSHKVMEIFSQDTKLNLSPSYLKPGQAFGGSCLPKDLRALNYQARSLDVEVPILQSILPSNQRQMERALQLVLDRGHRRVGVLGFSFKAGTDDLRESPVVELIERLLGKGFDLKLYDRNVNLAKLVGSNREFILHRIPHISRLMVDDVDEVREHAETLVVGTHDPEFRPVLEDLREGQCVVDLVRIVPDRTSGKEYDGICW